MRHALPIAVGLTVVLVASACGGGPPPPPSGPDPDSPAQAREDSIRGARADTLARERQRIEAEHERERIEAEHRIPDAAGGAEGEVIFPNSEYAHGESPVYRVWYGTNRKPADPMDESQGFSGDRDVRLHYGTAIVSVPESHKFGSIGSSWVFRFLRRTDDRLRVDQIVPRSDLDFFSFMNYKLSTRDSAKRTALVYIHGYNTTFEEAAIRAAQIGYDLKVEGVTAFFSWPSKGETYQYAADEAAIGASEPFLEEFLRRILRESGAERVNVVAHSMGNRGLLRVLQTMSNDPTVSFGQIILAAPDVDTQTFENLATVYPTVSDRTTLYVSSKDLALRGRIWSDS